MNIDEAREIVERNRFKEEITYVGMGEIRLNYTAKGYIEGWESLQKAIDYLFATNHNLSLKLHEAEMKNTELLKEVEELKKKIEKIRTHWKIVCGNSTTYSISILSHILEEKSHE